MSAVVSILIPSFNRADLIGQTLDSLLAQTHADWEAIVIDDNSTDQSLEVLAQYAGRDSRIRFFKRAGSTGGACICRNQALKLARGEYVLFLDCDDLLMPHCLAQRVAAMESEPQLGFGIFPGRVFKQTPGDSLMLWNADTGEDDIDRFLFNDPPWQTSSALIRRSTALATNPWNEAAMAWQDWDYYLRLLIDRVPYKRFDTPDFYWRAPDPGRATIGTHGRTLAHYQSRLKLVKSMHRRLVSMNALTPRRREGIAWQIFLIASAIAESGDLRAARTAWKLARKRDCVGSSVDHGGSLLLRLWNRTGLRRRLHHRLKRLSPVFDVFRASPTHLRTALPYPDQVPIVSVVMTAYNSTRYIESAVQSIQRQTFEDFELIIVDDGSTDNTREIVSKLARYDKRIRLLACDHRGIVPSANEGIGNARGEYLARMDSDDLSMPQRFEWQVSLLRARPEVVLVGGAYQLIDSRGRLLHQITPPLDDQKLQELAMSGRTPIAQPLAMMRREAVDRLGRYHATFEPAEDLDLWLRLGEIGQLACVPQVILKYRMHANSISEVRQEVQAKNMQRACQEAWKRRGKPGEFTADTRWRAMDTKDSRYQQTLKYGWWAFNSRERATARWYGRQAIKANPLRLDGYRLLLVALIKPLPSAKPS